MNVHPMASAIWTTPTQSTVTASSAYPTRKAACDLDIASTSQSAPAPAASMAKYAATTSNLTEVAGIGWPISSRRLATAQTRPGEARATPIERGARSPSATLKAPATARMQAATANNQYQTI